MFENIKLIATDLDGTLLTVRKEITERTKRIIEACVKEGAVFVPCTGRAYEAIPSWLRSEEGLRYYICTNGAMVYDREEQRAVNSYSIDSETVRKISGMLSPEASLEIITQGILYTGKKIDIYDYGVQDYFQHHYYQTRKETEDLMKLITDPHKPVEKVQIICKHEQERSDLLEKLGTFEDLYVCAAPGKCIEITDQRATKGAALKILCDHLKLEPEEVLYFGDQTNDMTALDYFPYVIAMENADPKLKEKAYRVTESNENEGVAEVMEEWLDSYRNQGE